MTTHDARDARSRVKIAHGALLGLVLLIVAAVYAHVTGAWFCGYDDFNEGYRAVFFDAQVPSRIFTTTHFQPFMYRPVTSALQLATWELGHGPLAYRVRNLLMHLASVAFVYGIAFLLGRSRAVATAAAALFGLSPLTNEAVVVAIWTNTTAYALLLGAIFFFLCALRSQSGSGRWGYALVASLLAAFVAIFTYEPTIVVFAILFAYLAICVRPLPSATFLAVLGGGTLVDLSIFFAARRALHAGSAPFLHLGNIAKDLAEYLIGLVLPIDVVLTNAVFGFALPASGQSVHLAAFVPATLFGIGFAGLVAVVAGRQLFARLGSMPWTVLGFLALSIPLSIVPIVLYKDHVSEFNLYVPMAMFAIAIALALRRLVPGGGTFAALVTVLLASYAAGTIVRNERVIACGRIAHTIVDAFPVDAWRSGTWNVRLATAPSERLSARFGIYNYSGLETIEVVSSSITAAEFAARLASGNAAVNVNVVPAADLGHGCSLPRTCYDVFANGTLKEVTSK